MIGGVVGVRSLYAIKGANQSPASINALINAACLASIVCGVPPFLQKNTRGGDWRRWCEERCKKCLRCAHSGLLSHAWEKREREKKKRKSFLCAEAAEILKYTTENFKICN